MYKSGQAIILALCLVACGDSESPTTSTPEYAVFDPAGCKNDPQGMLYFALGREVFRRPIPQQMSIRGMPAKAREKLPPPPDPDESEGCFGNPIWGSNFGLEYYHQPEHPENYPSGTKFKINSISLIALSEEHQKSGIEAAVWGTQISDERTFERYKNTYNSCEKLENGLMACRVPKEDREILSQTTQFQADPAIYEAPFGRPFTVSCLAWGGIDRQDCSVAYNYTSRSRIVYKFELHAFPPLEIIEFDKGLRKYIESMRVADYRWADQ